MKLLKNNLGYLTLAIGIVFVWRGVWGLADLYLIPSNLPISFIVSVLIGVTILFLHDIRKKDLSELE